MKSTASLAEEKFLTMRKSTVKLLMFKKTRAYRELFHTLSNTSRLVQGLLNKRKRRFSMNCSAQKPKTRQRRISWGVLLSLAGYFLNLCTVSPLVHADTLRQLEPSQAALPDHCKQLRSVTFPSVPPADHKTTPEPLCCEFRGGQNKALSSSFPQLNLIPFLVCFLLPLDATSVVAGAPSFHDIHTFYSSRPPPLYLLHAALLI